MDNKKIKYCRKTYRESDYVNKCKELDLVYLGNHKEKKVGTVIDFICNKHKEKGIQSKDWSHLHTYTYGCSYCSGRGKTNEDIKKEIKDDNVELISDYLGNEKPIKCRCKKCLYEWETLPKVLVTNGSGCPECGKIKRTMSRTKTQSQFVDELKQVNPDIEVIGHYGNTHTKIECKCRVCNTVWYGYPANLLNKSASCLGCNISIGEKSLLDSLKELNVDFVPQYSIHDGTHRNPLRFDAYIPKINTAIEFNGEQHYFPVDFAGKGDKWASEQFEATKERDKSKYGYCDRNGIQIIIIPYWEKDDILNIIKEELYKIA